VSAPARPADVAALAAALAARSYLADRGLATALHLALELPRPLLLEGDAGVGKTEAAKVLAEVLGAELVRLQCHEGIDRSQALYAWDHPRQLLHLRALEASGERPADHEDELYSTRFLLARPLLRALELGDRAVLLIDEIDRADDEFEAFLLELLSDFQVSVPELGTIRAERPPVVLLTSNRTRELSDALKRRCLYHWIDHPDVEREAAIVRVRAPEVPEPVAVRVAALVARLRALGLYKPPGTAETIDWARVVTRLGVTTEAEVAALDREALLDTLGVVVKDHDDLVAVRRAVDELLAAS
jgi:MoxR-like ATPase